MLAYRNIIYFKNHWDYETIKIPNKYIRFIETNSYYKFVLSRTKNYNNRFIQKINNIIYIMEFIPQNTRG